MTDTDIIRCRRHELLSALAAAFTDDEETLPADEACARLSIPVVEAYDPEAEPEDGWDPHVLARALRRVGVFAAGGLWAEPYDGRVLVRAALQAELDTQHERNPTTAAPAAGEAAWDDGCRFTTRANAQVHVYPLGAATAVQVVSGNCSAPETEVIAVFDSAEIDQLISALTTTREKATG